MTISKGAGRLVPAGSERALSAKLLAVGLAAPREPGCRTSARRQANAGERGADNEQGNDFHK